MIEKRQFGLTGHASTRTLFGAAAFFTVTQTEADRTMDILEEYGVNHIDTAASYGDSEVRLGPWLKHNRKKVFLATKTEEKTYKEAKEELYRSLDRLKVDSVDLGRDVFRNRVTGAQSKSSSQTSSLQHCFTSSVDKFGGIPTPKTACSGPPNIICVVLISNA